MGNGEPSAIDWLEFNGTEHVAEVGNLVVVMPVASPTRASLARVRHRLEMLADRGPKPILMVYFPAQGGVPHEEVRPDLQDMVVRLRSILAATAVVVSGDGFWAATQRAAAVAIFHLARVPNLRVHGGAREALDAVAEWLHVPGDLELLSAEIDAVCRDLAELSADGYERGA